MNVIIDRSTGQQVAQFPDYTQAAEYRRDVLRSDWRQYAIRGVSA